MGVFLQLHDSKASCINCTELKLFWSYSATDLILCSQALLTREYTCWAVLSYLQFVGRRTGKLRNMSRWRLHLTIVKLFLIYSSGLGSKTSIKMLTSSHFQRPLRQYIYPHNATGESRQVLAFLLYKETETMFVWYNRTVKMSEAGLVTESFELIFQGDNLYWWNSELYFYCCTVVRCRWGKVSYKVIIFQILSAWS